LRIVTEINILEMKRIIFIAFIVIIAAACTQQNKDTTDYKAVRDEVMKFHDVVMGDHSTLVNNQMKLDTLLKNLSGLKIKFPDVDTLKEEQAITEMLKDLSKAEDEMNDWMHKFEPDVTGKSNEVAVQYFKDERKKIEVIDSLYKQEIKLSDDYLSKFKK
jgi:GTPase involved in cell partitioning and DNA repair